MSKFGKRFSQGFTLIELMIVIVIAAILITIAAPSFSSLIKKNNVEAMQSKLASAISTARTEAASRNKVVAICPSTDGATCTASANWDRGWVVFEDANQDQSTTDEEVIDVYEYAGDYTMRSSGLTYLSFNSQGFLLNGTANTIVICEPDGTTSYARGIYVNASGLVIKTQDTDNDGIQNIPGGNNLACP